MMNRQASQMGKVVVFTNLTLDGVMQAPGLPDEDLRGGFEYGACLLLPPLSDVAS